MRKFTILRFRSTFKEMCNLTQITFPESFEDELEKWIFSNVDCTHKHFYCLWWDRFGRLMKKEVPTCKTCSQIQKWDECRHNVSHNSPFKPLSTSPRKINKHHGWPLIFLCHFEHLKRAVHIPGMWLKVELFCLLLCKLFGAYLLWCSSWSQKKKYGEKTWLGTGRTKERASVVCSSDFISSLRRTLPAEGLAGVGWGVFRETHVGEKRFTWLWLTPPEAMLLWTVSPFGFCLVLLFRVARFCSLIREAGRNSSVTQEKPFSFSV